MNESDLKQHDAVVAERMRAVHPRADAFRVGSSPGDGVPSSLGTGGITRQERRSAEREAEKLSAR